MFRKTTCSLEVFKRRKIGSKCHVNTCSPSKDTGRKPPVNAAFTNSAKQKKTFRKTVCCLGAFERRKTAREYYVFHAFTFNVIWLENLSQTPSLPTPANNRKTFRKTVCSLGVFERKKIAGEYHVFLVLTIDTIRLENLRQTPRWTTQENNR